MNDELERMKAHHSKIMNETGVKILAHINKYGHDSCAHGEEVCATISNLSTISNYHRGCYNTLIAVQKMPKES